MAVAVGGKSLRVVQRTYDSATDAEVASTELVGVYFDTRRRCSAVLPESVHARAAALRLGPDGAVPRPLDVAMDDRRTGRTRARSPV